MSYQSILVSNKSFKPLMRHSIICFINARYPLTRQNMPSKAYWVAIKSTMYYSIFLKKKKQISTSIIRFNKV